MHVEFRISEISQISLFESESFYRMKQLMAMQLTTKGGTTEAFSVPEKKPDLLSLCKDSKKGTLEDLEQNYKPKIQLQLLFEKIVKFESSEISVTLDRKQHEKQKTTRWDDSDIRTKRYHVVPQEVVLASLPLAAADCVVKIRLLQLSPPLSDNVMERQVDNAIGLVTSPELPRTAPLCVGVAKITLKELMSIRGGICIALQPKQTMMKAVEEHTLNTVATKGLFGADIGGSAFFTFQVLPYAFGSIPTSKLLLYRPNKSKTDALDEEDPGSISREVSHAASSKKVNAKDVSQIASPSDARDSDVPAQMDNAALRFIMVPYMALVDLCLRFNDVISWRRPLKTVLLLLIFGLTLAADLLDVAVVIAVFVCLVLSLRTATMLYHMPVANAKGMPIVSPQTSKGSFHVYLYGKRNVLLNAMVRARLFYSQGLQQDSFYELVLVLHCVRKLQRPIVAAGLFTGVAMCIVSVESILLFSLFVTFTVYPISLHMPPLKRKKRHEAITLQSLWRNCLLNRPMRVVRVVHVSLLVSPKGADESFFRTATPKSNVSDRGGLCVNQSRSPSLQWGSTYNSMAGRPALIEHRRAHTMDLNFAMSTVEKQQNHYASHMSFAVICFKNDLSNADMGTSMSAASGRETLNSHFLKKMAKHLESVKQFRENAMCTADAGVSAASMQKGKDDTRRKYFSDTLNFLRMIRSQCTMHTFIAPSSSSAKIRHDNCLRLDIFVRNSWLVERGDDDGITATIIETGQNNLLIGKLPKIQEVNDDARALALFAACLLQGTRLSLYSSSHGMCCTIIPLVPESDRIERQAHGNLCPPSLFSTLEDIWRGTMGGGQPTGDVVFTMDAVLQIIATYKDSLPPTMYGSPTVSLERPLRSNVLASFSVPRHTSHAAINTHANFHTDGGGIAARQVPYGTLSDIRRSLTTALPKEFEAHATQHGISSRVKEASDDSWRGQVSQTLTLDMPSDNRSCKPLKSEEVSAPSTDK
ncbi:hypothetical protein STCU_08872 [Strigomonas culicis]|uniref:Uncharacterized protein n=1 Tax=Strigomonas culicis TaxID=28005 RepID=S9VCB9_9TRYP|nr:hypothetical protein STCU_08872 [Strigomonas culicis]|eukprot:EPY20705.1 hypothetical protein STCU_08872 [Strigomonas culicis]